MEMLTALCEYRRRLAAFMRDGAEQFEADYGYTWSDYEMHITDRIETAAPARATDNQMSRIYGHFERA